MASLGDFRTFLKSSAVQKYNGSTSIDFISSELAKSESTGRALEITTQTNVREEFLAALEQEPRRRLVEKLLATNSDTAMTKGELKIALAVLGERHAAPHPAPSEQFSPGLDSTPPTQVTAPTAADSSPNSKQVDFVSLGETPATFPELEQLKHAFSLMPEPLKPVVNHIRQLYVRALQVNPDHCPEETQGSHVFYGGHVVVEDHGRLYEQWCDWIKANEGLGGARWSSHHPNSPYQQYEIRLPNLGSLLFGKTEDGHTWFQNESHATTRPGLPGWYDAVAHILYGFTLHKLTGHNVGALGLSPHSEKTGAELHICPNAGSGIANAN